MLGASDSDDPQRAVIVGGTRTPFTKAGGDMEGLDVLSLGKTAVNALLALTQIDPSMIDATVFGNVSRPAKYHNLAREIQLGTGIPATSPASTVSLACASSCQATTNGVDLIERGYADVVLAGGAESLSNVPVQLSPGLVRTLMHVQRAKSMTNRVRTLATLSPRELVPVIPSVSELSTGLTMGESAEVMAKANNIGRKEQDEFAFESHRRAEQDSVNRASRITPAYLLGSKPRAVTQDGHIRRDTSMAKLGELRPVFDRNHGTVTAGNSSPLSDGAAALLLMSLRKAKDLGFQAGYAIRSYAYAATEPGGQLLMGPAYAIPIALKRAGLELSDIDVVEMHEAFAVQVLTTVQALESETFAQQNLGRATAVGQIDRAKLNVGGGSIGLGHPFGATGVRVLIDLVDHLTLLRGTLGLASVCAAGGIGCAIVVERL